MKVPHRQKWKGLTEKLRSILLDCGLDEEVKWGKPCFLYKGKNVAIIQPFKEHCSLMFFKGARLEDPRGLLRRPGENTQSARRLEFTGEAQVKKTVVRSYVMQAIGVEKDGTQVPLRAKQDPDLPEELVQFLEKDPEFRRAFQALTPGRRRGYLLHLAGAKQAKTRIARIRRCRPGILAGKGINEPPSRRRP